MTELELIKKVEDLRYSKTEILEAEGLNILAKVRKDKITEKQVKSVLNEEEYKQYTFERKKYYRLLNQADRALGLFKMRNNDFNGYVAIAKLAVPKVGTDKDDNNYNYLSISKDISVDDIYVTNLDGFKDYGKSWKKTVVDQCKQQIQTAEDEEGYIELAGEPTVYYKLVINKFERKSSK